MHICLYEPDDADAVRALLDTAFKGPVESQIVDALRADDADALELVAEIEDRLVGEIMFSPVTADLPTGKPLYGIGLGPVAVLPDFERQGIASVLIENGLNFIRQLGVPFCILLGDPGFYQRFGFNPGRGLGWAWEKDPEHAFGDAFQVLSLSDADLPAGPVVTRYHKAFDIDPES